MSVEDLPHLNAALNGAATTAMLAGYACIRRRRRRAHAACMLAATLLSAAFLASYVVYHANVGSVKFTGQGIARPFYYSILLTHVVLAAAVPFLVGVVLYRAARRDFFRHRRLARGVFPIWFYVSVSGIAVYLMLYHFFPRPAA